MTTVKLTEDLKHNGPHICPGCGGQSNWKALAIPVGMIEVDCKGDCRTYTMSYAQLKTRWYFTV